MLQNSGSICTNWSKCIGPDLLCVINTFYTSMDSFEKCLEKGAWLRERGMAYNAPPILMQNMGPKVSQPRGGIRKVVAYMSSKIHYFYHYLWACIYDFFLYLQGSLLSCKSLPNIKLYLWLPNRYMFFILYLMFSHWISVFYPF